MRIGRAKVERAATYKSSKWWKRLKARAERRRAKQDPECQHGYGRYTGYGD